MYRMKRRSIYKRRYIRYRVAAVGKGRGEEGAVSGRGRGKEDAVSEGGEVTLTTKDGCPPVLHGLSKGRENGRP
jgi:hypothetical protein